MRNHTKNIDKKIIKTIFFRVQFYVEDATSMGYPPEFYNLVYRYAYPLSTVKSLRGIVSRDGYLIFRLIIIVLSLYALIVLQFFVS